MKLHSTSDFRKNDFDTFVGRANIVLNCVKVNGTKQLLTGSYGGKWFNHLIDYVEI